MLSVNSKLTVDIELEVGQVTESVTVSADSAMVETSTGEVGRLITGEQATKIQLNGRNFAQLLSLLPASPQRTVPASICSAASAPT